MRACWHTPRSSTHEDPVLGHRWTMYRLVWPFRPAVPRYPTAMHLFSRRSTQRRLLWRHLHQKQHQDVAVHVARQTSSTRWTPRARHQMLVQAQQQVHHHHPHQDGGVDQGKPPSCPPKQHHRHHLPRMPRRRSLCLCSSAGDMGGGRKSYHIWL